MVMQLLLSSRKLGSTVLLLHFIIELINGTIIHQFLSDTNEKNGVDKKLQIHHNFLQNRALSTKIYLEW
jgi:hypothetical protein